MQKITVLLILQLGVVYYHKLKNSGDRVWYWRVASEVATALAEMAMLLLVILLAKGWTLVRYKISASGRVKIAIYMSTYFVILCISIVWAGRCGVKLNSCVTVLSFAEFGVNPADDPNAYLTAPKILFLVLWGFASVWVLHAGSTTARNFEAARPFYGKFIWAALSWTASIPIVALLGYAVPDYTRHQYFHGIQLAIFIAVQAIMLALYRPDPRYLI